MEFCECTIALLGLALLLCWYLLKRPKNFPPGPHGLPLVGYTPFMGDNPAELFRKMKSKYGSVMSVQMGRDDWVVLNDYDTIMEALVKQSEKFSGRPKLFMLELVTGGRGLAMVDYGPTWKTLRKFGLMTLRGFGVGKKGMEENVIEETRSLTEDLTTQSKRSLSMKFTQAVSNIICRVAFGSRFEYDDKEFLQLLGILRKYLGDTTAAKMDGLMTMAPILRFLPPFSSHFKEGLKDVEFFMGIIGRIIEEHKEQFDENDIRDFIDAFLKEMKTRDKNDASFNKLQLIQYIRDLFEAGTGTTSSTLCWAILCLAHYPKCQEKIADEVEKTLGSDGVPTMKHRDEMPYTCAFIQELMRHRTLAPFSVFHKTNEEATLNGYTIPKNTTISPNLWAVHFDSKYFYNPEEFCPERFIDDGGKFIKSNHVIPFSVGPRHCVGEQLARMEIFIFLVGIIQQLRIVPDPKKPLPAFDVGAFNSVTYEPLDFEVIFQKR
uniref:cytochrome P450 2U1-like n=1 Tax=Styela clava TaxID=7725 RepID=UPI0019398EC6|nr:cytochrome P450 2U1-like [Styela clava]